MSSSKDSILNYCKEHADEFRNELRDEASRALRGWPSRIAAILMLISTLITYFHPANQGNVYLNYILFAYAIPILLVALYTPAIYVFSVLEKFGTILIDVLCFTGIAGFLFTLSILLNEELGTDTAAIDLALLGQINFVLLLSTAFSYHTTYHTTFIRNAITTAFTGISLAAIDIDFLALNFIQILQGFLAGSIFSRIFYITIRTRFYLKATDADTRQHLYNQLSKLVYSHQLERIKLGDELESTMPLKEGKAIVNVFDVQKSTEIKHERTRDFFLGVFQSFLEICMQGYEHNPLRSRAFRLKETGDGFISAVGYPFLPIETRSLADSAVAIALDMFHAFNVEVEKFKYSRPIKGAMGLAYNSIQGTFQSGGIRSYDLFGNAIIQAAKYEELRKQPALWDMMVEQAKSIGLDYFHILIVQEVIYNSLSQQYRDLFYEVDLWCDRFKAQNFQLLYDNDARYIYFHVLE